MYVLIQLAFSYTVLFAEAGDCCLFHVCRYVSPSS